MPRHKPAPAQIINLVVLREGTTSGRVVRLYANQTIRQFKLANFSRLGTPDQIHLVWRDAGGLSHTVTERQGQAGPTRLLDQFGLREGDVLHLMVVPRCES